MVGVSYLGVLAWMTYLEGQRYVLGNTDAGIRPAVREAIQLCNEVRCAVSSVCA